MRNCEGCETPISKGKWCHECGGTGQHMRILRQTAKLLRDYGRDDTALAVDDAAAAIVANLRRGDERTRAVSIAAVAYVEEVAAARARRAAEWDVAQTLERQVGSGPIAIDLSGAQVYRIIADTWQWILEFVRSLDDQSLTHDVAELESRARAFIALQIEALSARGCTCGHPVPHDPGLGCRRRSCGCLSPARLARAARGLPAREWSVDELRSAWPTQET